MPIKQAFVPKQSTPEPPILTPPPTRTPIPHQSCGPPAQRHSQKEKTTVLESIFLAGQFKRVFA
eukprot:6464057-Amphidinium_carterae.1